MRRVEFLLPNLHMGGRERMAIHLARGLRRHGWEASFVLLGDRGALADDAEREGFAVDVEPRSRGPLDLRLVGRLRRRYVHEGHPPELVHAHGTTGMIYAALGATRTRRSIVCTEHGRTFDEPIHDRLLFSLAGRMLHRTVAVSHDLAERLVASGRCPPDRIEVIHNGIPAPLPLSTRAETRRKLGIPPEAGVAICVARLAPVKDHASLLAAWQRTAVVRNGGVLLLVGDGPERANLERQASAVGRPGSVRFLGCRGDVADLLAVSDVAVLASRSEGLSLFLIEAAACGIPSIATDTGGNREVVRTGETGILVPPADIRSLSAALDTILGPGARRVSLGREASDWFRKAFTAGRMAERYAALYERLTAAYCRDELPPGGLSRNAGHGGNDPSSFASRA